MLNKLKAEVPNPALPLFLALAGLLVALGGGAAVHAQAPAAVSGIDLILLIDDSGSMEDNDPTDLRLVAGKLLVSLLDGQAGDRVAIIRFSSDSRILADLTPVREEQDRRGLLEKLNQFSSFGATNMRDGLRDAEKLLLGSPSDNKRFVVLLSDGQPGLEEWSLNTPTPEEVSRYLDETLEIARGLGVSVLPVSLGNDVDLEFMERIAASSLGQTFTAQSALDLPAVYLQILSFARGRTVLGPGPVSAPGSEEISISSLAQQAGFVIVKDRSVTAELIPPGVAGALDLATRARTFTDDRFDVIIPHELGAGGLWEVRLAGSGRVNLKVIIIRSRLEIVPALPAGDSQCAGDPWLIEAGLEPSPGGSVLDQPTRDALTRALTEAFMEAQITTPDGGQVSLPLARAESGEFRGMFEGTDTPGRHIAMLRSEVDGLELSHRLEVLVENCPEPPAAAAVMSPPPAPEVNAPIPEDAPFTPPLNTNQPVSGDDPFNWWYLLLGAILLGLLSALMFLLLGAGRRSPGPGISPNIILPAPRRPVTGALGTVLGSNERGPAAGGSRPYGQIIRPS